MSQNLAVGISAAVALLVVIKAFILGVHLYWPILFWHELAQTTVIPNQVVQLHRKFVIHLVFSTENTLLTEYEMSLFEGIRHQMDQSAQILQEEGGCDEIKIITSVQYYAGLINHIHFHHDLDLEGNENETGELSWS